MSIESELALEYFKLGNGVTAFYVVQTLLFLNLIPKEPKLLAALCNSREFASKITWRIAIIYISIVLGCVGLEIWLRYESTAFVPVIASSLLAAVGRSCLIAVLAYFCSQLIKKHLNVGGNGGSSNTTTSA